MDIRAFLFLFVLNIGWCCNARVVTTYFISTENEFASALQKDSKLLEGEVEATEEFGQDKQLCTLCEEFSALTLGYLAENKTQTEIITILHKTCSKLLNLEEQCIILVDYYAPLLFLEVSKVQPEEFCRKVDLCEHRASISQRLYKGSCDFCHQIVAEALEKLKDPDTQLDIVELLLKICNAVESHARKCKRIVFEYAPLILANAEKFLEKQDICTILHACSSATSAEQASSSSQTIMHSAY